jgi:hypothetical protein
MSDQGGNEASWKPDPHGRHEYRWWDGNAWTDQVSNGGVVSTDPPGDAPTTISGPPAADTTSSMPVAGPPSTQAPPYVAPTDGDKPKGKVPVGILALIGLVVAALVAGAIILFTGGDDGGGGSGTGEFSGSITDDDPFFVRTFDLEAGQGVRAIVEPDGDLDARLSIGVDPEVVATQAFGVDGDDDALLSDAGFYYDDLFSDAVDGDLSADLSEALSDQFDEFQDTLSDRVPSLSGAGVPIGTNNDNGEGDPEGGIFVAPLGGQYSLIVSGAGSTGDFEGRLETTGPSDDWEDQDPDEDLDLASYYAGIEPLRDFLCDEDFWGGDPTDVTPDAEQLCDDDAFDELLSGDFSADISDFSDFSDFSSDFSDFSDFSSDFSDFSDDFSDFTDPSGDVPDIDQGDIAVGDSDSNTLELGTRNTYTLEGTGGSVTIEVIGSYETGGLDPTEAVEDSSGNEIGTDDDGNPEGIRNSLLEVTLEEGETYTVAVAALSNSSSGTYTISVS